MGPWSDGGLNTVRVTVRVHPRAAQARRVWNGTHLELWLRQPPVDGAANEATIEGVARWLGVRRGKVRLLSGATARTKVLEIEGISHLPPPDDPAGRG